VAVLGAAVAAAACAATPPTITPPPAAQPGGSTVIEMTLPPPALGPVPVPATVGPLAITELAAYRDPEGKFGMSLPLGWPEQRQPVGAATSDVKLGTLFQSPGNNGFITVTHFDNGQAPTALGPTINDILRTSGWMDRPGFRELARENVIDREGQALRLQITYNRSDGVPMHSLVLFQIDGTTLSMVNVAVERSSWQANEGTLRDLLDTYRVPAAVPQP
jgi:hypothetical protein